MAKLDRTFSMQVTPEQAQDQFLCDLAGELRRKTELTLYSEQPGRLTFAVIDSPGIVVTPSTPLFPRTLKLGPHIEVTFEPDTLGTTVTIKGRCERDVRDALDLLGRPGQWPETAARPHG